ncbi:hypothetical protein [Rossellomorea marisflavi]|uniref:hypothetical protein n=1 Tax=Rossellomorea marisflavi TaxID=189381 RepID=UPI001653E4BF
MKRDISMRGDSIYRPIVRNLFYYSPQVSCSGGRPTPAGKAGRGDPAGLPKRLTARPAGKWSTEAERHVPSMD